ncbi:PLP-dependent transferase [Roridomyces roridus]|uniref:PLP-dependent transferase n=1 Tax=Roridomyces roridus TaxID=1738132 RepID=A0AAD7BIJ6_9AGAR|nr:PLP-dependent transferase [Roridomyces roridus]
MSSLAFKLSRGIINTITPPIPLAYTWAEKYTGKHGPLLDMSQGSPGNPPQSALQSALSAASISTDSFRYANSSQGELVLRQAMAEEMCSDAVYGPGSDVTAEDLSLTAGCNMAFVATIMALADAGDEVILPVPWYFNHQMTLSMLNITTVPLETRPENGFIPSVAECRALITPKTRAIVLVTPNNPTGAIYSPGLIHSFFALAHEHKIALILDETYRDFITPPTPFPPHTLFANPTWRSTLIHLFSFSKAYAIPGHRLGLVAASPSFQTPLTTVLDSLQICAPRPIQLALSQPGLLSSLRPGVVETACTLEKRRALFGRILPRGWHVGSIGGYFAFVRHPFKGRNAVDVCRKLAEEVGVLVLPATFFRGGAGEASESWIRFSVANCDEEGIRGVYERLERCEEIPGWEIETE